MLLQHYGLPVIVVLNRFGSDTEREFEMIRKQLGEQRVEALVCEHYAKGSNGATNPVNMWRVAHITVRGVKIKNAHVPGGV